MHTVSCSHPTPQVPFFPPLQSPKDFTEALCRQLVAGAAGLAQAQLPDLNIRQVGAGGTVGTGLSGVQQGCSGEVQSMGAWVCGLNYRLLGVPSQASQRDVV